MALKKFVLPLVLAGGLGHVPAAMASLEIAATVSKDEANEFSCASKKRVPVTVKAEREFLPEARYQYSLGGGFHVLCADHAGGSLPTGKKVRVSLNDTSAQILP